MKKTFAADKVALRQASEILRDHASCEMGPPDVLEAQP